MTKLMLVDASHEEETRVVLTDEQGRINELDFVSSSRQQIKSNIYLAKITRVEPSLQCAFVEYGGGKQGFLSISEIHPDYYQIPIADRQKLLEEEAQQQEEDDKREAAREEANEKRNARRKPRGKSDDEDEDSENADADDEGSSDDKPKKSRKRSFAARAKAGEDLAVSAEVTEEDKIVEEPDTKDETKDEKPKKKPAAKGKKKADPDAEDDANTDAESDDKKTAKKPTKKEAAPTDDAADDDDDTDDNNSDVEVMDDEEELDDQRKSSNRNFTKRYKIQEVIKHGQIMLVQVVKEERGNKGVSLSTYISLPGRYCVLMPNSSKGGGISRKISNRNDRKRLKEIASELKESRGISAIIRTAGIDRTKADIKRDYEYLIKLWNQIREEAISSTAPALVYEEGDVIKRSIRDYYHGDIEKVYVQGEEAFNTAKEFMKILMPSHAAKVKHYTEDTPLFYEYDIESQLQSIHTTRAKLKSGGYLDINPTEALISVDVNSGRSTSERNVEETAVKTNLEAAAELGRQMRLRDLGGLIVIDFIDMYQGKNRRAVERAMKDALKSDRAKIQMARISSFGLMEMSRQRLRPSMAETTSSQCPRCEGTGMVRSPESLAIEAVRVLEKEAAGGNYRELRLSVHNDLAVYMLNHSRQHITDIEKQSGVEITIKVDPSPNAEYTLERILHNGNIDRNDNAKPRRTRGGRNKKPRNNTRDNKPQQADNTSKEEGAAEAGPTEAVEGGKTETTNEEGSTTRGRRRRRGPRGNRGERGPRNDVANENEKSSEAPSTQVEANDAPKAAPAKAESSTVTKTESDAPAKKPTAPKKPVAKKAEVKSAPAKEVVVEPAEKKPAAQKSAPKKVAKDTPVDPKAPKKKGWWRKVVD